MNSDLPVGGTDIWYYFICKREAWLNMHQIVPDEEDENVEIGRFIHEYRYGREKKEVAVGSIKMDRLKREKGELVVREIKKSSKFLTSSRYQLLYYLYTLKQMGIDARGELLFPEEKRKENVELTEDAIRELKVAVKDIQAISQNPIPPAPKKIGFCRNCAYREFCWAEG